MKKAKTAEGAHLEPSPYDATLTLPALLTAGLVIVFGILPWAISWQMKLPELAVSRIFGG